MKLTSKLLNLKGIINRFIALLFFFSVSSFAHQNDIPIDESQPYDNVPISSKTWEEIDIAWKNPYNKAKPNTAQLVRPIKYANEHGLSRGNTDVRMNLTEFGVPNAHVWVTHVKPLTNVQVSKIKHLPNNEKPLIGLYQHQVKDVRTYTFKDQQGHISAIHATPSHRFYVLDKGYRPLHDITGKMHLIDANGYQLSLVCRHGHRDILKSCVWIKNSQRK